MDRMKKECRNCKFNKYSPDGDGIRNHKWYCGNEYSENYGVPTFWDETCDDFEEKE